MIQQFVNREVELEFLQKKYARISSHINAYYGLMFEQLVLNLIKTRDICIPFSIHEVKKWWYKEREIDSIALNTKTKEILFVECKWKDNVNAEKILFDLKEKAQHVRWFNNSRKEYFAVFAKSFSKKSGNCLCFDLNDLEKMLKKG